MSTRFPFPTKLNPLWWLKNADDVPPPGYTPWQWWWRNPCHNMAFYIVGCADRRFIHFGPPDNDHCGLTLQFWPPFICPFIAYNGPRVTFYLGWRHAGEFGAKLNIHGFD